VHLRLQPNSGVPLGVQLVRQISLALTSGLLKAGDRLPPARELAAQLKINFHTVRKAYGDLESRGILTVDRGRGTFVSEHLPRLENKAAEKTAGEHLRRLCEDLAGWDLKPQEVRKLVTEELDRILSGREKGR
jgi:DNA-binding transcriptional regulator YhcF (GntR family)